MKKDYQRMTEKAKDGSPALITEMIFHELEKLQGQGKMRYYTDSDVLNIVIKYLAELEDKIENGTLVELPCKVGDTIYRAKRFYGGYWIDVNTIVKCEIFEVSIRFYDDNDNEFDIEQIGESVFLTKAEAEAKLKELQGAEQ